MSRPANTSQIASKDRKQAEDLDGEERQTEDVCCRGQTRGEDRAGHEGRVGAHGCGDGRAGPGAVVEGDEVEEHEPEG